MQFSRNMGIQFCVYITFSSRSESYRTNGLGHRMCHVGLVMFKINWKKNWVQWHIMSGLQDTAKQKGSKNITWRLMKTGWFWRPAIVPMWRVQPAKTVSQGATKDMMQIQTSLQPADYNPVTNKSTR